MMTPHEKLRALIDQFNKQKTPSTGGDNRTNAEVMNTSAIARNMAMDRFKIAPEVRTLPLRQLMRNK